MADYAFNGVWEGFGLGFEGHGLDFTWGRHFFLSGRAIFRGVVSLCKGRGGDFDSTPVFGLWEEEEKRDEISLSTRCQLMGLLKGMGNEVLTPCKMAQIQKNH